MRKLIIGERVSVRSRRADPHMGTVLALWPFLRQVYADGHAYPTRWYFTWNLIGTGVIDEDVA